MAASSLIDRTSSKVFVRHLLGDTGGGCDGGDSGMIVIVGDCGDGDGDLDEYEEDGDPCGISTSSELF